MKQCATRSENDPNKNMTSRNRTLLVTIFNSSNCFPFTFRLPTRLLSVECFRFCLQHIFIPSLYIKPLQTSFHSNGNSQPHQIKMLKML